MGSEVLHSVIVLTGCNIAPKEQTLQRAAELLDERVGRVVAKSEILYSEAWGFSAEERFANQALELLTRLEPLQLLDLTQAIERELGRDRESESAIKSASGERYCSRTIDIDIMFYDDVTMQSPRLTLPHPLMQEREFTLRPMAQIAPERRHKELGMTVAEMLQEIEHKLHNKKL